MEENVDYYYDNGLMVLTKHFLLKRGKCCKGGCRNCPYGFHEKDDSVEEKKDDLK